MIEAQVICDSISPAGKRLTTFKLRYPKFIHGEFMTHRVISRNAGSSRAIPTSRLIEEVRNDALRAAPVFWGKNQPGMQAAEELTGDELQRAKEMWKFAAEDAAARAELLVELGGHKQIVNRLLEPFSHIAVVATATEWDNFFGLRLHHMAQPEMRALAETMWRARDASAPRQLESWDWHWPFIDTETSSEVASYTLDPDADQLTNQKFWEEICTKVSVARCARVSYDSLVSPGKRSSIEEDLATYAKLNLPGTSAYDPLQPIHASPAEHQATPDELVYLNNSKTKLFRNWDLHGNFIGWCQYRKTLAGEACAPLPAEYQG